MPLIVAAVRSRQPLQSIPAEKIMKKPIPDEHLVLKTTFEGLIQKCLAVAADPVSVSWTSSARPPSLFNTRELSFIRPLLTANQEEARRRQQTLGSALRQTQRADGECISLLWRHRCKGFFAKRSEDGRIG